MRRFCYRTLTAIILNESDLKPLYQSPAAIDELLQLIEKSLAAHSRNEVAGQTRMETTAADPKKKYRIMTAAVPEVGCGMRINALFRGAKDAYFHLLFDNRDSAPHNVTILDANGESTFVGETFGGPASRIYAIPALAAGTYRFRCDVHTDMTGSLVAG